MHSTGGVCGCAGLPEAPEAGGVELRNLRGAQPGGGLRAAEDHLSDTNTTNTTNTTNATNTTIITGIIIDY